jgi:hypothetical protein
MLLIYIAVFRDDFYDIGISGYLFPIRFSLLIGGGGVPPLICW